MADDIVSEKVFIKEAAESIDSSKKDISNDEIKLEKTMAKNNVGSLSEGTKDSSENQDINLENKIKTSDGADVSPIQGCKNSPSYTSDGSTDLFASNSEFSSNASSPVPPEPFKPLYSVKIIPDDVTKDGDVVKFTLISKQLDSDGVPQEYQVLRQYKDFEWLNHQITTSNNISGLIVPPLPSRIESTIERSKKQLGDTSKTLLKDEFGKYCSKLEKYLTLLLKHYFFGEEDSLQQFLTEKEIPVHTNVKQGFFNKLSSAVKSIRYNHEGDCEDFFKEERITADNYYLTMKESRDSFDKYVSSQLRCADVLSHLSTALLLCYGNDENQVTSISNKLNNLFSKITKESKNLLETLSDADDTTLGSFLELYTSYLNAEKEMLFRRTCLLVEYENANRALDKTKSNPAKYELAVQQKQEAEKNFEQCSDVARQEIKRFHRERVHEFKQSLVSFTESRLKNSLDACNFLTRALTQIKQIPVADFIE